MPVQAFFARAVAVRAAPAITAISPNTSPALTEPIGLFWTSISISPTIRMYMRARAKMPPFSFSVKTVWPCAKPSGLPTALKNSIAIAAL